MSMHIRQNSPKQGMKIPEIGYQIQVIELSELSHKATLDVQIDGFHIYAEISAYPQFGRTYSTIDNGHIITSPAEMDLNAEVEELFIYDEDGEEVELTGEERDELEILIKQRVTI